MGALPARSCFEDKENDVENDVESEKPSRSFAKRSTVKGFSYKSRRRLMQKLATVDKTSEIPVFVTLTYPDNFPYEPEIWARHIDIFGKRLARRGWGFIWRKELKTRQSGSLNTGKIAPHFHLLVWGSSSSELRSVCGAWWYEISATGDPAHLRAGTRVENLDSWKGVFHYVSKYLGKSLEADIEKEYKKIGRSWGVVNGGRIPWAGMVEIALDYGQVNTIMRYMRRYMSTVEHKKMVKKHGKWVEVVVLRSG